MPLDIEGIIRSCFASNSHGAGWMIKRGGEKTLSYEKGFMDVKSMIDSVNKLNVKPNDEFVMHFRIATSGKRDETMTHPFVCSKSNAKLKATKGDNIKCMLVAHNGVMSQYAYDEKNGLSDTACFARDVLGEYNPNAGQRAMKKWRKRFSKAISFQRLAIMYPDHDMELLGNFVFGTGTNMFFSNTGYKYSSYYSTDNSANCRIGQRGHYADYAYSD